MICTTTKIYTIRGHFNQYNKSVLYIIHLFIYYIVCHFKRFTADIKLL